MPLRDKASRGITTTEYKAPKTNLGASMRKRYKLKTGEKATTKSFKRLRPATSAGSSRFKNPDGY